MFTVIHKNKSIIVGVMLGIMLLLTVSGCSDPGGGKTPGDTASDTDGQTSDASELGTGGKPSDNFDPDDGDAGDEDEIIRVGQYALHLGEYRLLEDGETVDDPEGIILLTEDAVVFAADTENEEGFKYTVENNALVCDEEPLFLVTGDDRLDMGGAGFIVFVYTGGGLTMPPDGPSTSDDTPDDIPRGVNIRQSEAAALQLVDYDGGEFTMKIPKGWQVSVGGLVDSYMIRVYDPSDERNQIFLYIAQSFAKSQYASQAYAQLGFLFPYMADPSVEQVFKLQNDLAAAERESTSVFAQPYQQFAFPYIADFSVVESFDGNPLFASVALDNRVLRATFNNGSAVSDGECEGLFSAALVDLTNNGGTNSFLGYYTAYFISGVSTAKDGFINYESVLLECLNSIQYREEFVQTYVDECQKNGQTALDLGVQLNQAYQSYNDAWSARQKSYDIQSQKQSDLTLGYERVVDTETGDIYRAYNGFTDEYQGDRFQTATDSQYADPIAGYIDK